MTGRSLHEALVSVLCDPALRRDLPAGVLGAEEAAALGRSDRRRLDRLARFIAGRWCRARVEHAFRHCLALARRRGGAPEPPIETPVFATILDDAMPGSPATAERIGTRIEGWIRELFESKGGPKYWPELLRYEGAIFRTEACRPARRPPDPSGAIPSRPLRKAPSARVVSFGVDVVSLAARLERIGPDDPIPWAVPDSATRLMMALSPKGSLRVVRCSDALEGFLALADGQKDAGMILQVCGMDRSPAAAALRSLLDIGAIEEVD